MIRILTDSCADLGQPLLDAYNIQSVPLHVLVKDRDYFDDDLKLETLFRSVEDAGQLPKTAAPSVIEFLEFFKCENPTLYIGLSSQLSATMHNATIAKHQLNKKNLYLVDSLNLSTGIGLLALKAADLRGQGLDISEIVNQIEDACSKVKTAFLIDTMEYLHKGGRCTGMQAMMGSMLKIRPIIHVRQDGSLGVLDKFRGSRKKALDRLLAGFVDDLPDVDLDHIFVTHTLCEQDALYLVESLKALAPIETIHVTLAGSTIASHCGPNTIGILYLKK